MSHSTSDSASAHVQAQRRIQQAAKNGKTFLDLSGLGLTSVPPEIGQLTQLTTLNLDKNQLTSVPPEIGQLTQLDRLDLDNNQLAELPDSLRRLSNLRVLFLHGNPQLNLPVSILGVSFHKWNGGDDTAPRPGPIL